MNLAHTADSPLHPTPSFHLFGLSTRASKLCPATTLTIGPPRHFLDCLTLTVSTLGTQSLGDSRVGVGETWDLVVTLLDNDEVKGLDVGTNDAASNRFPSPFTSSSLTVARLALAKEETNTSWEEDTYRK